MRPSKRSSLIHLIYFSRAQLSAEPQERARQVNDIARHAQKKNEFSVITSLLIVDQGYFIQILEGERMSVQETFQRISGDIRHRDVHIVEWREIAKREFVTSFAYVLAHRDPTTSCSRRPTWRRCSSAGPRRRARSTPSPRLCKPTPWPSRASTTSSSRVGPDHGTTGRCSRPLNLTHFSRRPGIRFVERCPQECREPPVIPLKPNPVGWIR